MNNTKDLVIIDKAEYAELVSKAAIYDAYARKLEADKERGGYVSEYEQAMFVADTVDITDIVLDIMKDVKAVDCAEGEEPEEIFTEEEWKEKVIPLTEEEEVKEEE